MSDGKRGLRKGNVRRSPFRSIASSLAFPSFRRFLRLLSMLEEYVTTILGEVASDSARSARRNGELEISSKKPPDAILSHLSLLPLHLVLATENNGASGWSISRRSTSITSRTVDRGGGEGGRKVGEEDDPAVFRVGQCGPLPAATASPSFSLLLFSSSPSSLHPILTTI